MKWVFNIECLIHKLYQTFSGLLLETISLQSSVLFCYCMIKYFVIFPKWTELKQNRAEMSQFQAVENKNMIIFLHIQALLKG